MVDPTAARALLPLLPLLAGRGAGLASGAAAEAEGRPRTPRRAQAQGGNCTWPACAWECLPCGVDIVGSCPLKVPFVANCPPLSECKMGKCVCMQGFCAGAGVCEPRVCHPGALPPRFRESRWARFLSRFGPPPPPSDGGFAGWSWYSVSSIGVPLLLLLAGSLIAGGTGFCLMRGLASDCGLHWGVPRWPIFLLFWSTLTVCAVAVALVKRHLALRTTFDIITTQLERLEADLVKMLDLGQSLNQSAAQFEAIIDEIPISCSSLVPGMTTVMERFTNAVDKATDDIFEEVRDFNDILEPLPGRIHAVVQFKTVWYVLIYMLPMIPLLAQFGTAVAVVAATLVAWCTPESDLAKNVHRLLDRCGSWVFAALTLAATVLACTYLHVGIVCGAFCRNVDDNVVGLVNDTNFTEMARGRPKLNNLITGAAEYYIKGGRDNPLLTLLLDLSNNVNYMGNIYNETRWMPDTGEYFCPAIQRLDPVRMKELARHTVETLNGKMRAANIWPYYNQLMHSVFCKSIPKSVGQLIVCQILVGIIMIPILALIADWDLKKWAALKDSHLLFEDESSDEDSWRHAPPPPALRPLQSAPTYTHRVRTTPSKQQRDVRTFLA